MSPEQDAISKINLLRPPLLKVRNQDIGKFFSSIPSWMLFLLIILGYLLVVGIGVIIGYQHFLSKKLEASVAVEAAVASIFGLLAFILGFTFSLTWTRFANRNNQVILQARTLNTCFLRTGLLPETQKQETRKLLHEYVLILLNIHSSDLDKSIARIETINLLIWQQVVSLIREDIDSELRSLFTASANDLISQVVERKTIALVYRIPDAIWSSLLLLAAMGMLSFGYMAGLSGVLKIFQLSLLPTAFALIIGLIADLNSTGNQRRFKVSQKPFYDILEMMEKEVAL